MTDTNTLTQVPGIGAIQAQIHNAVEAAEKLKAVKEKMEALIKPFAEAAERENAVLASMMRLAKLDNMETPNTDGNNLRAEFVPKQAPKVTDWDALHEWIADKKRFDLLQKRVTSAPVIELFQMAVDHYDADAETQYPTLQDFAVAKYLPPGVLVTEWKELKISSVKPKKPRRAAG